MKRMWYMTLMISMMSMMFLVGCGQEVADDSGTLVPVDTFAPEIGYDASIIGYLKDEAFDSSTNQVYFSEYDGSERMAIYGDSETKTVMFSVTLRNKTFEDLTNGHHSLEMNTDMVGLGCYGPRANVWEYDTTVRQVDLDVQDEVVTYEAWFSDGYLVGQFLR